MLGEEKGLEATDELSFELTASITKAHESVLKRRNYSK